MKSILFVLLMIFTTLPAIAQEAASEGLFRQSGKMYVVVSILTIIFIGIVVYLISLDRKISRLEKEEE
jgi:CcmD family protein